MDSKVNNNKQHNRLYKNDCKTNKKTASELQTILHEKSTKNRGKYLVKSENLLKTAAFE
jgi:hypothetical protein